MTIEFSVFRRLLLVMFNILYSLSQLTVHHMEKFTCNTNRPRRQSTHPALLLPRNGSNDPKFISQMTSSSTKAWTQITHI